MKFSLGRVVCAINHTHTALHFPHWSPRVIITGTDNLNQSANQVLVPYDHIFIAMGLNCMLRQVLGPWVLLALSISLATRRVMLRFVHVKSEG
jgi:hypothetical protein